MDEEEAAAWASAFGVVYKQEVEEEEDSDLVEQDVVMEESHSRSTVETSKTEVKPEVKEEYHPGQMRLKSE